MSKIEYDDSKNPAFIDKDCECGCVDWSIGFKAGYEAAAKEANAEIERLEEHIGNLYDRMAWSRALKGEGTQND